MKTSAKTLLVASLSQLIAMPAIAGRYHNDIRLMDRMERQHEQIERGIQSGELDRMEVRKLRKDRRKIPSMFRQFRKDDMLTKKERRILKRQLDNRSNRICEFRHNDRERNGNRCALLETGQHHQRDRLHLGDDDYGNVDYWLSDSEDWPRYGFLYW